MALVLPDKLGQPGPIVVCSKEPMKDGEVRLAELLNFTVSLAIFKPDQNVNMGRPSKKIRFIGIIFSTVGTPQYFRYEITLSLQIFAILTQLLDKMTAH